MQVRGRFQRGRLIRHDRLVDQDAGVVRLGGGGYVGEDEHRLRVGPVVQDGVKVVRRCAWT